MPDHYVLIGGPDCRYLPLDLAAPGLVDEDTIDAAICGQPAAARATSTNGHTAVVCAAHADHLVACPDCSPWLHDLVDLAGGGPWHARHNRPRPPTPS